MFDQLHTETQDIILSYDGQKEGYQSAQMGNRLRDAAAGIQQSYAAQIEREVLCAQGLLESLMAQGDDQILAGDLPRDALAQCHSPAPTAAVIAPPTLTPGAAQAPGWYAVTADTATVREGPGLRFPIAAQGRAHFPYGVVFRLDTVQIGDPVAGDTTWGHLADGLGFISMGAVRKIDTELPLLPHLPPSGFALLAGDRLPIREAPHMAAPIAAQSTAHVNIGDLLLFDAIVQDDQIGWARCWGHLSSNLGFIPLNFCAPGAAPEPPSPPGAPAEPPPNTEPPPTILPADTPTPDTPTPDTPTPDTPTTPPTIPPRYPDSRITPSPIRR